MSDSCVWCLVCQRVQNCFVCTSETLHWLGINGCWRHRRRPSLVGRKHGLQVVRGYVLLLHLQLLLSLPSWSDSHAPPLKETDKFQIEIFDSAHWPPHKGCHATHDNFHPPLIRFTCSVLENHRSCKKKPGKSKLFEDIREIRREVIKAFTRLTSTTSKAQTPNVRNNKNFTPKAKSTLGENK